MKKLDVSNLHYFQNASGDTATMRIYKPIGGEFGIQGELFAQELEYLCSFFKKINVRINSPGGNILEGYAIFSSILTCKVPVYTYNDGVAASMAGVILMAGKKVYMADYAKLMLHGPHNGNPNPSEKEKATLIALKDSLVKIFETRTSQNADEIAKMMDKETWLNAQEALELGFVDEVISYPNKRGQAQEAAGANAMSMYKFYVNLLGETEEQEKNQNFKKMEDKKILEDFKSALGLKADATEKETIDEIRSLRAKGMQNDVLLREIENLKAENEEFKKNIEDAKKANASNLVEEALAKGKIRATQKEQYLKLALTDFELAKDTINSLSGHPRFSEKTNTTDERSGWTFSDYLKKDPEELQRLKNEEPSTYSALYKAQYGFPPSV